MNFIDKAIDFVSPVVSLKRTIARQRNEMLKKMYKNSTTRSFDAISNSRLQADHLNEHNDADTAIHDSLENLRNYTRQIEYNNGYVKGPLRRMADHIVGTGFRFQSRVVPDKKHMHMPNGARITKQETEIFNYEAEKYKKQWDKQADVRLLQNHDEMAHLIDLARHRDGEVLVIGRNSKRPGRLIPYCQQLVEIDRLETPPGYIAEPDIYNGIKYDKEGVPVIYYIRKRHPGDSIHNYKVTDNDFEPVPAFNPNGTRKVIHLFRMLRPEQTRGFSEIAAGLPAIQTAFRYASAEMFAALQDACMVGIIKTTGPANFQENYTKPGPDSDKRLHNISPGKNIYLDHNQEMTIRDPSRPNDKFSEILHSFYEGPANAMNMPPEVFLQNWRGMNYSNARTVLIMWLKVVRIEQQLMIDHYESETWANVLPQLISMGKIQANAYSRRSYDYLAGQWIPPKIDWVDPLKEVQGKKEEITILSETPQSICAMKGSDFEENAEAMARALVKNKELEKEFDIKMPPLFESGTPFGNTEEDDEGDKGNIPKSKPKNDTGKVIKMKK